MSGRMQYVPTNPTDTFTMLFNDNRGGVLIDRQKFLQCNSKKVGAYCIRPDFL